MALSPLIQFECRASATANNVNGGGFKAGASGTDYSQQDAAYMTATDFAVVGTAYTRLYSATLNLNDATLVGNIIHIPVGTNFTAGWYEITAVGSDGNGDYIDIDRNCATVSGASGATGYIGGAMSLNSTLDDDFFEIMTALNGTGACKIWIKAGSYTLGEAVSIAATGGTQAPIVVEGYNATRGDAPTGTNRPTISQAANAFTGGSNWEFYNLIISGTAAQVFSMGSNGKIVNCKITNTSSTVNRTALYINNPDIFVLDNEAISYFGRAFWQGSNGSSMLLINYCHDSDIGIFIQNTVSYTAQIIGNIVESCVTAAVRWSAACVAHAQVFGNILYGSENTTGIGIDLATGVTDVRALNNIIYGFATGVSHADVQTVGFDNYNCYNNNDTDVTNWTKGANDVTTAPGFSSVAQVTGTGATSATDTLTDSAADFINDGVVAGDHINITASSTGTNGIFKIDAVTATTLTITLPTTLGTRTGISYQITTGHNFAISTNLKALGFPGVFQGGFTTGYMDIGAVQRQEVGGGWSLINGGAVTG